MKSKEVRTAKQPRRSGPTRALVGTHLSNGRSGRHLRGTLGRHPRGPVRRTRAQLDYHLGRRTPTVPGRLPRGRVPPVPARRPPRVGLPRLLGLGLGRLLEAPAGLAPEAAGPPPVIRGRGAPPVGCLPAGPPRSLSGRRAGPPVAVAPPPAPPPIILLPGSPRPRPGREGVAPPSVQAGGGSAPQIRLGVGTRAESVGHAGRTPVVPVRVGGGVEVGHGIVAVDLIIVVPLNDVAVGRLAGTLGELLCPRVLTLGPLLFVAITSAAITMVGILAGRAPPAVVVVGAVAGALAAAPAGALVAVVVALLVVIPSGRARPGPLPGHAALVP